MYEHYWNLNRLPFENSCDTDFYFASQTHQAALLKMQYVIENRHGVGLLAGGIGSGKTYLVAQLKQILPDGYGPFVHVVYPQMTAPELLAYVGSALGDAEASSTGGDWGLDRTIHGIEQQLKAWNRQDRHPILVVDEAHLIDDPGVFQGLQLLLNFRQQPGMDFTLFLVGERQLIVKLQRIAQLEERIAVKGLLQSFTLDETIAYVMHRLEVAGCARSIFDRSALESLHQLSAGVPRRINRLCDLALLVGFADELREITEIEMEAVGEELATVVPD